VGEQKRRYFAANGVVKTAITDDDYPDRLVVHTEQDVGEILDGIARDREIMRHGVNKKLATLPTFIWEDLVIRGIAYDEDAFKKWLNSSEATPWRIWGGRV
jgi:hypothetical protein